MNNLTKTVEILTAIALADSDEKKAALVDELRELSNATGPEFVLDDAIRNVLTEVGVPWHLSGFDYCVSAVRLMIHNPYIKHAMTKELYPAVAKEYGKRGCLAERSIRHAVEVAFYRGDEEVLHKYFGNTVDPDSGKPTNTEFLCRVVAEVKRRGRLA